MPSKITLPDKKCLRCGKKFGRESCQRISDYKEKKFCSHRCYSRYNSGAKHWYWRGGFKNRPDGYIRESKTDRYVHRLVMEKHLGRKLKSAEHIHHLDGNPKNNIVGNLIILSNAEHRRLESKIAPRGDNGRYTKKRKQ